MAKVIGAFEEQISAENDSRKKGSRETGPILRLVRHEKVVGFSQPREEISRPGRQNTGMRGLSQV